MKLRTKKIKNDSFRQAFKIVLFDVSKFRRKPNSFRTKLEQKCHNREQQFMKSDENANPENNSN